RGQDAVRIRIEGLAQIAGREALAEAAVGATIQASAQATPATKETASRTVGRARSTCRRSIAGVGEAVSSFWWRGKTSRSAGGDFMDRQRSPLLLFHRG